MRIENRFSVGPARSVERRAGAGHFSIDASKEASSAQTAAPVTLSGLDGLLALQAEEDPLARRRRAARRGHSILDALDRLKVAILSGRLDPAELGRIRQMLSERREATADPALDDALAQIELRASVELAKLAARPGPGGA
ncbi:flagellar assembly protein FliX [Alsobacter sp. SYSU M60028]|uniref:Flagellar assembly protein FliX n=1 Tax=Alsobacter ponti TaxID=2962936 RepID=A0ABT1LAP1_9HYPH|nr:flagellar assembly protein FliX [Alsobacter ponti]MCP8937323.1 flagellar assembly protein FliX [Alsobacter ponti]